jgi:hypothetical protein
MSFSFARDDFDAISEAITHRADLLNLTTNPKHSIDAPSASARGWPLAHANAVLVLRIYGRFMPTQQERQVGTDLRHPRSRMGRGPHQCVYHTSKQHEPTTVK